jgi:hypothetical protein
MTRDFIKKLQFGLNLATHLNGVILCIPIDGDLYLFLMFNESESKNK